jgi:hypothetical protein
MIRPVLFVKVKKVSINHDAPCTECCMNEASTDKCTNAVECPLPLSKVYEAVPHDERFSPKIYISNGGEW